MVNIWSRQTQKSKVATEKKVTIIVLLLLLAIAGTLYFVLKPPNKTEPSPSPVATRKSEAQPSIAASSNQTPSNSSSKSTYTQPTANAGQGPLQPSGRFVSNHNPPSLSSSEESVCTTSPNALCFLSFTQNGIVKSLQTKTTDSNGSATWAWTPESIGLTKGAWKISATATLNNQ